MGKNSNTTKKGKQKAPVTAAAPVTVPPPPSPPPPPPPPLVVSSPPTAHHIPYSPAAVDTIEEQDDSGGLSGGPVEGAEEESWQDVGHPNDYWAADVAPENSNTHIDDSDGWGTGPVTQPPMSPPPPQPPQKQPGGRDRMKSHYPQQPSQLPSSNLRDTMGAHNHSANNWGSYAKPQQPQDPWIPENDGWGDDDGWGEEEDGGDGWGQNDGCNDANGGWGEQPHSATWTRAVSQPAHSAPQATSHAPASGWQSWGEEARRLPKVTFDPAIPPSPPPAGSKSALSQQQRSQILNALLNNPQQNRQAYPMPANPGQSFPPAAASNWQQHPSSQHENQHQQQPYAQNYGHESKNKKGKPARHWQDQWAQPQHKNNNERRQEGEVHDVWGLGDGWSDLNDEEDQQATIQDGWGRKVHFTPSAARVSTLPSSAPSVAPLAVVENFTVNALPRNKLGLSTTPMSKTLSYAYSGTMPSTESEPGRAAMQRMTDIQFVESRGEALKDVQRAFYGKQRKASERFHWLFSPDKDERVSSLLGWIDSMAFGIASFGLQKFLQTRERGALFVNAAYRPAHSPSEPAFDWITWDQIRLTMDRILQESVGYYRPAMYILVFVFLPSPSGNSVAIWRRKLLIPDHIRLAYQAQLTQAMGSLRKDYRVVVDELPAPPKPPPPKKKRKWYKLWLSS